MEKLYMSKHLVGGLPCKDLECWCNTLPKKEIDDYGFFAEDVVNHPKHYQLDGLQVEALEIIKASLTLEEYKGYLIGNLLKYLLRHKKKNNIEDIRKMIFYSKELDKCL